MLSRSTESNIYADIKITSYTWRTIKSLTFVSRRIVKLQKFKIKRDYLYCFQFQKYYLSCPYFSLNVSKGLKIIENI